ncbi:hypothetical protein [Actinoplanes philippinensis]|uniref:hypothetical protein n=1 Tax=Actinoplanes philippinensis TaxID=35752 RepID=UPI0033CF97D9
MSGSVQWVSDIDGLRSLGRWIVRGDTSVVTGRRVVHLLLVIGFALVAYVLLSLFDRGARADGVVPGSPGPAAAATAGKVPAVAKTPPRKAVVPKASPRRAVVPKVPSREVAVAKVPARRAVVPKVPARKAAGPKVTSPEAALAKPVERTAPAREVVGSATRLPKAAVPKLVERIVPARAVAGPVTSTTALAEATRFLTGHGDIAGLEVVDPAWALTTSSRTLLPRPPANLVEPGTRQVAALHVDPDVVVTGTVPAPHPTTDLAAAVPGAPASGAGPGSWAVPLAASRVPHSHGARSFVPSKATVTGHGPLPAPDSQAAGAGQFRDAGGGGASPAGTVPSSWRPATPVAR